MRRHLLDSGIAGYFIDHRPGVYERARVPEPAATPDGHVGTVSADPTARGNQN